MGFLRDFVGLIRARQWYKNIAVFLPILFSETILNTLALNKTVLAFFALCFISSTNYIINDIIDLKQDKLHHEKKLRPLAAGRIPILWAVFFGVVFFTLAMIISLSLNLTFTLFVLLLFILTQVYSFWLKKEAFADVLMIAVNFVIRAISGAFVITTAGKPYIWVSPWLILCPFFLSLFLSIGKRHADNKYLGKNADKHKTSLKLYSPNITRELMSISTTLLLVSYALYTFLSVNQGLMITIPFAIYAVFRYFHLIESGSEISRHPEKIVFDLRMMISIMLWFIAVVSVIYVLPLF